MRRLILMALGAAALSGCSSQHAPLIFGQAHSVGIAVGTNPANQTPEISVGYKDVDIAIVPTVYDGNGQPIRGTTVQDGDAYSTFGHFSADARTTEVGLGKFFATGIAARRLADGFACKVSSGTDQTCTRRPPIPPQ